MKKNHSSNRSILVLECPWELDDGDANRSSVLPFVEGIAKFAGDMEVFHANFYDKNSFEKALDCLCKTKFKNSLVYIAAHGYKKKIGDVNILDLLVMIGLKSKSHNITGVMLGSCFVGGNTSTLEACIQGTSIRWCAGYSSESSWLTGTMIDCSIMSSMSELDEEYFSDKSAFVESFADAIAPFSKAYPIGCDYHDKNIRLDNSLQVVIQPVGQGSHARTITSEVFNAYDSLQG